VFDALSLGLLGTASVLLALALTGYGIVSGLIGIHRRDPRWLSSARFAAVAVFLALTASVVIMQVALLTDDFSVGYVAKTSRIASPIWVKVVTMWAALEGSILLWGWLASGYTALLAVIAPNTALRPWALVIMTAVQMFFIIVIGFVANPFTVVSPAPLDGPGPNPLLQNHWMMAVHPLLMYLGFVGLTVPFAYGMAALITRRPGVDWMTQTRRWTLTGWGFLTAAIIAGGWWSYEVLGWGGFWAWDPVENVSILPWLTATAFIHSVQVQERRRMLKSWNVMLVTLTFALTIFGTFLTRSGVVSSVHAFGDGPVGPVFLWFFLLVLLASFGLIAVRWDQVRDRAELDSPVSREGSILLGNIVFLAITFAVLLGTIFPLIIEALTNERVTVGAPFFDQVSVPLFLIILLLMGIGPLLPWRRADDQNLKRNLLLMGGAGLAVAGVSALFGMDRFYPLLTMFVAGWNLMSLYLLIAGAVVPRARITGRSAAAVFRSYAFENRRRFGSMIVHFGIIVIAVAVMGASAYRVDLEARLDAGVPFEFGGYELTLVRVFEESLVAEARVGAEVEISRDGRVLATLQPMLKQFSGQSMIAPTPGVMYRPMHDVYLNVGGNLREGQAYAIVHIVQSPMVTWIWIGGVVVALGTLYCLVPGRNERRAAAMAREGTTVSA